MNLRSTFMASAFAVGLTVATGQASAYPFQGSFTVSALNSDPGLVIQTAPNIADSNRVGGPDSNVFTFDLANIGDSVSFRLFDIWTDEVDVQPGEDTVPKPISVAFNFTAPPPPFGGDVEGSTVGGIVCFFLCAEFGQVTWDGPETISFGPLNDGLLRISLEDETFNVGLFGLTPGEKHGAHIDVKFKLIANPTLQVPEPATLALFGAGLLGLGLIRRRKAA